VVTISNELGTPRYPTMAKRMQARKKQPTTVALESLGLAAADLAPRVALTRQFVPTVQGSCEMIAGTNARELADGLIARLRAESIL
jgi:electron transfer flavoprotein beta subunit